MSTKAYLLYIPRTSSTGHYKLQWSHYQMVRTALRHNPQHPEFNSSFRQLLHVGYKIAAKMGDRYLNMLDTCEESISRNVTENLYERHLKPLFLSESVS